MPPKITDAEFIESFRRLGAAGTAKLHGLDIRGVNSRRRRLERIHKMVIKPPESGKSSPTRHLKDYPGNIPLQVKDGQVLIGSDSHYWPGIISTAHRAFVHFNKELKPKYVIKNGDELDFPRISRHAPIQWESQPTVIQELETAADRLHEITEVNKNAKYLWPIGNHDCLDSNTECLTKRGWLQYDQIKQDDEILSLVDGVAQWSPINEIVQFPFDGELVRVEKTRFSMAVTPNHRVLLSRMNWRTKQYDLQEYRKAEDLPCSFNIPMAGKPSGTGAPLTDDEIALSGWLVTDACYARWDVSLYQSKPQGIAEIIRLLDVVGIKYSTYRRQRTEMVVAGRTLLQPSLEAWQFRVMAECVPRIKALVPERSVLPAWAHTLDARQFDILLDAMVAGNGTWDGNVKAKTCCVLYGLRPILESIQAVAVCHGWRARFAIDNRGDYRLCLAKEPKIRVDRPEVFREHYQGTVWCLRVPAENFMVRRNGSAYFTGNSRYETKLATVAPEYAKVSGMHLKDHFPRWAPCWSVWINDDVVIKHRWANGVHAVYNNTLKSGKTMVTGHLHSLKVTPWSDYTGTRFGVDCGTMADPHGPQFSAYCERNPVNWRSGFVILTFHKGQLLWPEIVRVLDEEAGLIDFRGKVIEV